MASRGYSAWQRVKKGLQNPVSVPAYVVGRLFPASSWGPSWRRDDGFITFEVGGFAGGSPSRAELCARDYHEATQIRRLLGERTYERSLEIGCGYGRVTGWIADHARRSAAVEPNGEVLAQAERLYPDVEFHRTLADDMPFADGSFDLVVSWAVLGHVTPEAIEPVADEVRRVLADDGTLLLCERTSGEPGAASWVRSQAEYEALFAPYEVVESEPRSTEPTFEYARTMEAMRLDAHRRPGASAASPDRGP